MATVTGVPVLLFKMRCMFFFTVKTCLCALSRESTLSFSSLSANPFVWRPLIFHMPCLVRLSLIFFLNGTIDSAISFRTLWTIFWLAKTSNKPISLTTWLPVNPLTCNLWSYHKFVWCAAACQRDRSRQISAVTALQCQVYAALWPRGRLSQMVSIWSCFQFSCSGIWAFPRRTRTSTLLAPSDLVICTSGIRPL